jgi:NAD(P)-dependent dehydrogenase (short-subunit alcohol dehydrogenase family)
LLATRYSLLVDRAGRQCQPPAKPRNGGVGEAREMADALQGKVVIVTGAGRGIGREIALAAAQEGAKVVVNDLGGAVDGEGASSAPAQEVVDAIKRNGGQAIANFDSVAEPGPAANIVKTAVETFGRIDGVVNNAGILRDRIFHRMSVVDWDLVLKVHLFGSFYVSRAAATHFREQESGAFVHFTSTSGLVGNFGQANYAAAKLGITALSKSIALDMQRFNVRSNCISPFAWSRMIGTLPTETEEEKRRVARSQTMTPAKIAPVAVFLLSDAAKDVTGQIFAVRKNEIMLMGQSRPLRSVHRGEGWNQETIAEHAMPALKASFYPLLRSQEVFNWDPA